MNKSNGNRSTHDAVWKLHDSHIIILPSTPLEAADDNKVCANQ